MIALDTNLLVYAHRAAVAQHQPARRAVTRASRSPVGPRIFDLQIGLMAFEGGATKLWTADRRFASPPGLPVVPALEA